LLVQPVLSWSDISKVAIEVELRIRILSEVAHLSAGALRQECDWVGMNCLGFGLEEGSDQSLFLGGLGATETFNFEGDQRGQG